MVDGLDRVMQALVAHFGALSADLAIYSIVVVFFGYVVLGVSGFGSALMIVPLLALRWPLATVVPMVLLLDVQSSLLLTRLNRSRVVWPELRALLPGIAIGAALGAYLATWTTGPWALALLGLYVAGIALRGLLRLAPPRPLAKHWALVFGAGAGVVESVFGTAGPLVVAWMTRRMTDPESLRANVPAALVTATCCALLGMASTGQLLQPILWLTLLPLTIVAFAGTRLGHHFAGRLPAPVLARIIFALLGGAGAAMVMRALGS